MEKSKLYDLLDTGLLRKWRKEREEGEDECEFLQSEREAMEELKLELNEKSRKLLAAYSIAVENRINFLYYNLNVKILNFGIKAGMDLQKAFAEFEE